MNKIDGIKLDKLEFNLFKKDDLMYYEGPLISHYIDSQRNNYLMNWVDVDLKYNRWLLYRVTFDNLINYVSKKVDLLNLILKNDLGITYLLDIDKNAKYKRIWIIESKKVPTDYLPSKNTFYDFEFATEYGKTLNKYLEEQKKYKSIYSDLNQLLDFNKIDFLEYTSKILFTEDLQFIKLIENSISTLFKKESKILEKINNISFILFPILVHIKNLAKESNQKNQFVNFLKNIESKSLDYNDTIMELGNIIFTEKNIKQKNTDELLNAIIKSTKSIVSDNPDKYSELFAKWLNTYNTKVGNVSTPINKAVKKSLK